MVSKYFRKYSSRFCFKWWPEINVQKKTSDWPEWAQTIEMQMSVKKSMSCFVFCFHFIISKLWCYFVYCGTKCSDDKISNSFGFSSWYFCIELLWYWKREGNDIKNQIPNVHFSSFIICLGFFFELKFKSFRQNRIDKNSWKRICTWNIHIVRFIYLKFVSFLFFCICCFIFLLFLRLNSRNNRQYPRYMHNFRSI